MYRMTDLVKLYQVSRQTVTNWCNEFADYLTPNANPKDSSSRRLNDDDVRVLTLVKEMSDAGKTYESIHVALKAGQRGDLLIPLESPNGLVPVHQQLAAASERLKDIEAKLQQVASERDVAIGRVQHADAEIANLKREVRELYQEIFSLKAAKND